MSAGRSDEAGKEFRRAVELGPGVPESWLTYVQYLVQTKQIDQAKTAIEAARKALPADRADLDSGPVLHDRRRPASGPKS